MKKFSPVEIFYQSSLFFSLPWMVSSGLIFYFIILLIFKIFNLEKLFIEKEVLFLKQGIEGLAIIAGLLIGGVIGSKLFNKKSDLENKSIEIKNLEMAAYLADKKTDFLKKLPHKFSQKEIDIFESGMGGEYFSYKKLRDISVFIRLKNAIKNGEKHRQFFN
jgi:hypothetical protein